MKKLLSIVALLGLFACSEKAPTLDGEYKMLNAPDNAEITIGFEGNRYFGKSAVNRYFGNFEKDGNKIKFGPAGATMMAGPENLMKAEYQYFQDLGKINAYQIKGKTLTLKGKDTDLSFEKLKAKPAAENQTAEPQ